MSILQSLVVAILGVFEGLFKKAQTNGSVTLEDLKSAHSEIKGHLTTEDPTK